MREKKILLLYFIQFGFAENQCRIETENGHLKFATGVGKDISFLTESGKIYLNGDDFSSVITNLNLKVDEHESTLAELTRNFCSSVSCVNGATCINLKESYYCECSIGWKGQLCAEGNGYFF